MHVLSTPPAFILSQDQTLMLKSFVLPVKSGFLIRNYVLIYCFKVASFIEAFLNYSQNLSRFFTVQLSMFVVVIFNSLYILSYLQVVVNNFFIFLCCRSFATTLISYHVCRFLSTTFLLHRICQSPLNTCWFLWSTSSSRISLTIISRTSHKVNNIFTYFLFCRKYHFHESENVLTSYLKTTTAVHIKIRKLL